MKAAKYLDNPNLDDFISDSQIKRDLGYILRNDIADEKVEINDEYYITIPSGAKLEVIAKSCRQNHYHSSFGDHYAVLVAIGGVVNITSGIPVPQYCYATLFYSSDKNLITLDFHSEMR